MALRSAVLFFAATWLAGCAGQFPMESARRPLLLPDGEHELTFALGKARRLRPYNEAPNNDWRAHLGYRYGVTDRINFTLPFLWSYGWTLDHGFELQASAGLWGIGWGSNAQRAFSGDPREPNARARGLYYSPALSGIGKYQLDDTISFLGRIDFITQFFIVRTTYYQVRVGGTFLYDFHPWWSLGLGVTTEISYFRDLDETDRVLMLGRGPSSPGETPLLAFHLVRGLDLTATAYLQYEITDDILETGALLGVDWYFD